MTKKSKSGGAVDRMDYYLELPEVEVHELKDSYSLDCVVSWFESWLMLGFHRDLDIDYAMDSTVLTESNVGLWVNYKL